MMDSEDKHHTFDSYWARKHTDSTRKAEKMFYSMSSMSHNDPILLDIWSRQISFSSTSTWQRVRSVCVLGFFFVRVCVCEVGIQARDVIFFFCGA